MVHFMATTTIAIWNEYLSMVEFAYNNLWQKSIKSTPCGYNYDESPSTLMIGRISGSQVLATKGFVLAMNNVIGKAKKY